MLEAIKMSADKNCVKVLHTKLRIFENPYLIHVLSSFFVSLNILMKKALMLKDEGPSHTLLVCARSLIF